MTHLLLKGYLPSSPSHPPAASRFAPRPSTADLAHQPTVREMPIRACSACSEDAVGVLGDSWDLWVADALKICVWTAAASPTLPRTVVAENQREDDGGSNGTRRPRDHGSFGGGESQGERPNDEKREHADPLLVVRTSR